MSEPIYTLKQICDALNITRGRAEQWIARGHFRPPHNPIFGAAREWQIQDAIRFAAFGVIVDSGIPQEQAGVITQLDMHGFKNDTAFFVVWRGLHETATKKASGTFLKMHIPGVWYGEIVKESALLAHLENEDVWSATVVNLDNLERKVKAALGYEGSK
ncbi:hypothetical protein ACH79_40225 [Bradyrhizobium sp. CCBAU 051011]|uniref:hypothetical protein n=1 Tax=Bradyrhizobium sp. CCBAU 051011 TaxID=858422 RepID=UPI001373C9FB|nr:hypothetical protein [Bradyrhizobium sp. CCBAU 051011]QHO77896.1 hypothetical protein ACH79_40225 [Bradyrhizobium sp. CCBAU 051011]